MAEQTIPGGASESDEVARTSPVPPAPAELTEATLREWLREWVAGATGQPIEQITVDRPMEEFGLASRDAIALSGDIEELTGVTLTVTVVYQHPTIASLADRLINGEPEPAPGESDDAYYTSAVAGDSHDIAIVGLATRFPGAGRTPESTWEFLINGGDGISDPPEGRWSEFLNDPQLAEAVATHNMKGGYLSQDEVQGFDAEFFAMSPSEVERVDPQQRLALELTWEALEHARIPASELKGRPVGVFIGSSSHDFTLLSTLDSKAGDTPYALTGAATAIVANRVSYFYDFRGPSVAVDTACSSTLVAVHQAVRALRAGEAELALAGGTNTLIAPLVTLGFDSVGAIAKDGHIKAFSLDADGMVRSEGGGLVVLKRLEDAERDGDPVLAVIKGSAVNSDGRSNGLLAPNPDAQADVLRAAYRDAGIVPSTVDYIEAHGTGTILGDPIEADALGRVVGRGRSDDQPALLGSAKTNFGHLESAAGAAALAKVVLAFQENKIPASKNYAGPNPYIDFPKAHLQVIPDNTDWPRYSGKAIAGISGFGFGGTNAHVVLAEYAGASSAQPEAIAPADGAAAAREAPQTVPLAVSAYLPSRRRQAAATLADWLESEAGQATPLVEVGRALASRSHGRSRAVILATDHAEAVKGLRAAAAAKPNPLVVSADSPVAKGPVWVLSGFGAQHRKMAKQLYTENMVFAKAIDEVDALIEDEAGYSIKAMYLDDGEDYDVGTSQVGIFAIQIGLAALLRHHGAQPAAVVGHSLGEVAGAYIAGGLNLEDAVRVICARSRLMGEGEAMISDADVRRMALVEYSADDIGEVLADYPDLEVAVYAAPTHTVIGGPEAQVNAIVEKAEAAGKLARVLQTRGAGHTSQMDPLLGELAAELAGIEPGKLTCGLYSTVDKETFYKTGHDPIHDVDYWVRNMRQAVYFTNAVRLAIEAGHTTFLELSPNPVALMQVLGTTFAAGLQDPQLIHTLKRKEDDPNSVIAALAQLYVHGHPVTLPTLFTPGGGFTGLAGGGYAAVPRTQLVRKRHWIDGQIAIGGGSGRVPGSHVRLPDGSHAWEIAANKVRDISSLVNAAAAQVLSGPQLGASVNYRDLPAAGTLTTTLVPHPGGGSAKVYAAEDNGGFTLLFEAVFTADPAVAPARVAGAVDAEPSTGPTETLPEVVDTFGGKWDPAGAVSAEDRLAEIVAETMGYAVEDLPREIPLIELGLDSLMAMRIKNRVEYEFDIPPLQLQAVTGATLIDVAKYLRYAIEHRDEVQDLADKQALERAMAREEVTGGTGSADAVAPEADSMAIAAPAAAPKVTDQQSVAEAAGADVPPRDNAERLTFATWAVVTGQSAKGIFNTLPILEEDVAEKLAARLSERAKGEVTVDDIYDSETIEQLSDVVRKLLEGEIDGVVRTLRARPEGSDAVPVFVFHPAGGSTNAYEPLLKRLPADTPMYGLERVEGSIEERAREYLPELRAIQGDGPYVLYGWSLGGVLALQTAKLLRAEGADVRFVGLIDVALSADEAREETREDKRARLERYAAFAKTNYGVEGEVPMDELLDADEGEQIKIIMSLIALSGAKIPGGVIEHQRTSWIDYRELVNAKSSVYEGDVTLYLADRYHDGAIELEPRFANRAPKGGWDKDIPNLEVIELGDGKGGVDHLQIIDEPHVGRVAADLAAKLRNLAAVKGGTHA